MKRHPYEAAADRELAKFPAVRVVEHGGQRRSIFYPCTPSDCRGIRRHLQDIRRVLREMGVASTGGAG